MKLCRTLSTNEYRNGIRDWSRRTYPSSNNFLMRRAECSRERPTAFPTSGADIGPLSARSDKTCSSVGVVIDGRDPASPLGITMVCNGAGNSFSVNSNGFLAEGSVPLSTCDSLGCTESATRLIQVKDSSSSPSSFWTRSRRTMSEICDLSLAILSFSISAVSVLSPSSTRVVLCEKESKKSFATSP